MSITQALEQIELSIGQAKANIEKMEALQRLTANKDFEKIVLEGYFEKEASRLVLLKAEPAVQGADEQSQINKSIDAIGYVRQYFNTIMQFGRMSERALLEDEKTREELLSEQIGE